MRKFLELLYASSGVIGVLFLVAIGALTFAQVVARFWGAIVPSADDFATFAMAGAIFFGLAHTYRYGGHVRVLALRTRLSATLAKALEVCCLAGTVALLLWLLWYTADMIGTTRMLNERTIGLVTIPTWIPMIGMFLCNALFCVAVLDDLVQVLSGGRASYAERESSTALPTSAE
jgi:TRAP-type C4-dicarboxylate transport system permease small subunit